MKEKKTTCHYRRRVCLLLTRKQLRVLREKNDTEKEMSIMNESMF